MLVLTGPSRRPSCRVFIRCNAGCARLPLVGLSQVRPLVAAWDRADASGGTRRDAVGCFREARAAKTPSETLVPLCALAPREKVERTGAKR